MDCGALIAGDSWDVLHDADLKMRAGQAFRQSMEVTPPKRFPVTTLPIFLVLSTKLFPQTKTASNIFGGGVFSNETPP